MPMQYACKTARRVIQLKYAIHSHTHTLNRIHIHIHLPALVVVLLFARPFRYFVVYKCQLFSAFQL